MPIPLIVWAAVALAGGAAAGKGGEALGERTRAKAGRAQGEAQEYVAAKQREYERKRRSYLERLRTFPQMIRAAVRAPIGSRDAVRSELPSDLQAAWNSILSSIESIAPSGSWLALRAERSDFHRKLAWGIAHRPYGSQPPTPQHLAWAAIYAGVFYSYQGVREAFRAHQSYNQVEAAATRAKLAADQNVSAIDARNADLEMRWEAISLLIHRAVGPPVDDEYAFLLLQMADDLSGIADDLMKAVDDE